MKNLGQLEYDNLKKLIKQIQVRNCLNEVKILTNFFVVVYIAEP